MQSKLSKNRNGPFSGPCPSKIIYKNQKNFTDLHCKGFKHCSPCLFNEPQTMNEHAPMERLLRHENLTDGVVVSLAMPD